MSTNKPTHEVYVVVDPTNPTGEAKARWTKIGVGFFKNDGMTLLLDAVPLQARLVVRPVQAAAMKGGPK
ncbi:MAG: hypothetical protein GC204_03740 [Chloroflexi bacterium]|nr:hypothetical protein [Chloroflexota bacterium]